MARITIDGRPIEIDTTGRSSTRWNAPMCAYRSRATTRVAHPLEHVGSAWGVRNTVVQ